MTALDDLISAPHLTELDQVEVAASAQLVWQKLRHAALAQAWPTRALFALRNLLAPRAAGASPAIRIDELHSSPLHPGFQILVDRPPHEVAVGAIGKVWRLRIPFIHVPSARDYAWFDDPDFVKVAWAIRVTPLGPQQCRVTVEVRVRATDQRSWRKFRRYFRVVGPFSRYIRRSLLKTIARELGGHRDSRSAPHLQNPLSHRGA